MSFNIKDIPQHDWEKELTANAEYIFNKLEGEYSMSLVQRQINLEQQMYFIGEQKFLARFKEAADKNSASFNPAIQFTEKFLIDGFSNLLNHMKQEESHLMRGNQHQWFAKVGNVSTEDLAEITFTTLFNEIVDVPYLMAVQTYAKLGRNIEQFLLIDAVKKHPLFYKYQKAFENQASDNNRYQLMKRVYWYLEQDGVIESWKHWDTNEHISVGHAMCEFVEGSSGLIYRKELPKALVTGKPTKQTISVLQLREDWIEQIYNTAFKFSAMCPEYHPMLIPPRDWTGFSQGGYYTTGGLRQDFIHSHQRNITRYQKTQPMPQVMEAINILQRTPWEVNKAMFDIINGLKKGLFGDITQHIDGWPQQVREFPPLPDTASKSEIDSRNAEVREYYRSRSVVKAKAKMRVLSTALRQAETFINDQFFIPYYSDGRGRIYAIPSHFNPQGNDAVKSLLKLGNAKPMGERGWYWLRWHCATVGEIGKIDKARNDKRVEWTDKHRNKIIEVAQDPIGNYEFWCQSSNPLQFLAAIFEVAHALMSGNPEQFKSGIVVAFDGSCSGLQHYSAMLRDEVGGAEVNLIPSENKGDIYGTVLNKVTQAIRHDSEHGSSVGQEMFDEETNEVWHKLSVKTMATNWMHSGMLVRDLCKRPVMTYCYSAKEFGMARMVREDVIEERISDENKEEEFFKKRKTHATYVAKLIDKKTGETVKAAKRGMDYIQEVTKVLMMNQKPLILSTYDGFPFCQEYLKPKKGRVTVPILNKVTLRYEGRFTPSYVVESEEIGGKQLSSVAPNVIHAQDATHLRITVRECYKQGVRGFGVIHDSFGVMPADAQCMFDTVRYTFVMLYDDAGNTILHQIDNYARSVLPEDEHVKLPAIPKQGKLDLKGILNSEFAFS